MLYTQREAWPGKGRAAPVKLFPGKTKSSADDLAELENGTERFFEARSNF
jgi:hypothetical protein